MTTNFKHVLVRPVPNLNGNNAHDLISKCIAIAHALDMVGEAMRNGSDLWHGRNFQHRDSPMQASFTAADAVRERRVVLDRMRDEWMQMALDIQRASVVHFEPKTAIVKLGKTMRAVDISKKGGE